MDGREHGRYLVKTLEHGRAVIRASIVHTPETTGCEVARDTGTSRAAVSRCLLTLTDPGYGATGIRLLRLAARVPCTRSGTGALTDGLSRPRPSCCPEVPAPGLVAASPSCRRPSEPPPLSRHDASQ